VRGDLACRFGRNLFLARRRAGYSQEELAVLCSLHRTEVGKLETGKRLPRVDTLVKLTTALEVSADELLRGIDWTLPAPSRLGSFCVATAV
jgi:transcriptional regulator with XRE-family HTH domain